MIRLRMGVAGNFLLHDTEQFRQKAAAGQRNDGTAGAAPGQFGKGVFRRVDIDDRAALSKHRPRHLVGEVRHPGRAHDQQQTGFGGGLEAALEKKIALVVDFIEPQDMRAQALTAAAAGQKSALGIGQGGLFGAANEIHRQRLQLGRTGGGTAHLEDIAMNLIGFLYSVAGP